MKYLRTRSLAAIALSIALIPIGMTPSAFAESGPDAVPYEGNEFVVSETEIDQALTEGTSPDSDREESAVEAYLSDDANAALTDQDVQVGTVEVDELVDVVVVVPEVGVEVESLNVSTEGIEDGEVQVGASLVDTEEPLTAGAGMAWPAWDNQDTFTVQSKIYVNDNWVGTATYETSRRKLAGDDHDKWQIARYALVKPDNYEQTGPDIRTTVKKIWISNDLTDAAAKNADKWLLNKTSPKTRQNICDDPSVGAGPWSFTATDCDEFDPWMGDAPNDIGHYRISFDQGAWSGGGQRELGYVAGFTMDEGKFPSSTWYQFATIRFGYVAGDPLFKCKGTALGSSSGTELRECRLSS